MHIPNLLQVASLNKNDIIESLQNSRPLEAAISPYRGLT